MTKQEFINYLKESASLNNYTPHWRQTYTNSEDYWSYYKPGVDGLEDDLEIKEDSVIWTVPTSLYSNEPADKKTYSFDELFGVLEYGCRGGNHDVVPILGFENSIVGEMCRQCGKKIS